MSYGPPQPYSQPKSSGGNVVIIVVIVVLVALLLVVGLCVLGMAAALYPAVTAARGATQKQASRNNLMQISMAIHNYHDIYQCLPPPMIPAKDGRPSKSWRTMILPFIEQNALHDVYDQNSPWDAPSNQAVRSARVKTFESPAADDATPGKTNYVVVVGPNTPFPLNKKTTFTNIHDGTSNTILVLEIANSDIEWSEPRDLDINTLVFARLPPKGSKNVVVASTFASMADGSMKMLPYEMTLEQLKTYLTASGGELVPGF